MPIEFHRDGPWELPEGWLWAHLGDLVTPRGEKAPPNKHSPFPFIGMDDVPANSLRIETRSAFCEMKSAGNKFFAGDILYGRLRPYLNKVVVADFEGVASGEFIVMCPKNGVEARYLQFWMHARRFVNEATQDTSGDRPRIDFAKIANLELPLPPSQEQRRIVGRVEELFTEVADGETALTRAREDLDIWRRALLKAAVTGELTRDWRECNPVSQSGTDLLEKLRQERALDEGEFNLRRPINLNSIPKTWAWARVGTAGEVRLGRQRAPDFHNGNHMRPYLRVANVFEGHLELSDVKQMNFTPAEQEVFELRSGDVLLNEGQSPKFLGRPAIYSGQIAGCCFQNTLLRFRPRSGVLPGYALIVFRHYMHCGRFQKESRITTNIAHLSQNRFVEIEFPLPPTKEQEEVFRRVAEFESEAQESVIQVHTFETRALRQSVLKAAFEGRLVAQDSSDEPAEKLLARLSDVPIPTRTKSRRPRAGAVA